MAMLFAINIAKGRYTFSKVPKFLKAKVKECLIDMDLEELAVEEA
ncbi:CD1375 family protein [Gemella bergeri]